MPNNEKIPEHLALVHSRCAVGETLEGGHCELLGEAEFKGLLLCRSHARQFEAQDRIDLLEGIISCLDLCLMNLRLRRDKNLIGLLRAQRAQAIQELSQAYQDLRQSTTTMAADVSGEQ
jgi:hypothetical protein